ncbi:MAG: hypothetical protein ACR2MS_02640 [Weeksellaceae bacterium]
MLKAHSNVGPYAIAGAGSTATAMGVHDAFQQHRKNKTLDPKDKKSVAEAGLKGAGKGALLGAGVGGLYGAGMGAIDQYRWEKRAALRHRMAENMGYTALANVIPGAVASGGAFGIHDAYKQHKKNKKLNPEDKKSVLKAGLKGTAKGAVLGAAGGAAYGAARGAEEQAIYELRESSFD